MSFSFLFFFFLVSLCFVCVGMCLCLASAWPSLLVLDYKALMMGLFPYLIEPVPHVAGTK